MTTASSVFPNYPSRRRFQPSPTDRNFGSAHTSEMPNQDADWYLKDWLSHFGKKQANLTSELGWEKSRASYMYHGTQPYKRGDVAVVSKWLGIEPYELLMPPAKALAIRDLYRTAERIIENQGGTVVQPDADHFLPTPGKPLQRGRRNGTTG